MTNQAEVSSFKLDVFWCKTCGNYLLAEGSKCPNCRSELTSLETPDYSFVRIGPLRKV